MEISAGQRALDNVHQLWSRGEGKRMNPEKIRQIVNNFVEDYLKSNPRDDDRIILEWIGWRES